MQPRRSVTYALTALAVALIAVGAAAMPRLNRPAAPPQMAVPAPVIPEIAAPTPPAPEPVADPEPVAAPPRPRIEVVFALDTTGSWDKDEFQYARQAAVAFYDIIDDTHGPEDRFGVATWWSNCGRRRASRLCRAIHL